MHESVNCGNTRAHNILAIKFDKFNFVWYADFNGKRVYRKVSLSEETITIQDFSSDVELDEYTSWGEENNGIKVEFSEGYKRFIWK